MQTIALDTETSLFGPGCMAPRLACVSLAYGPEDSDLALVHQSEAAEVVASLLTDRQLRIVGHNMAYDMGVLLAHAPQLWPLVIDAYESDRITDTMLRQKLCDIAGGIYRGYTRTDGKVTKLGYSLDDCTSRHLGYRLDKDTWRLRYGELIDVPLADWPEGARTYPKEDARATWRVCEAQNANAEYLEDEYRQARAALWLHLTSAWGIHTSAAGYLQLAEVTEREYQRLAVSLRRNGLLEPDKAKRSGEVVPGSRNTKAAGARIVAAYTALGRPVPLTDGGKPALDEKACEESEDPALVEYARFSSMKTVIAKDLPILESGIRTPIHTRYETLLETGRTSSSAPNIQNIRRLPGIRECFIPRPGFVFGVADYGGLELCTLAQTCKSALGYSALADALNADRDPHLEIASQIMGAPYETLHAVRKGESDAYDSHLVDDARQTGKVANFGFPGGLGAAALVEFAAALYHVHLTPEKARELKATWLATWPEMRDYFVWIASQTDAAWPSVKHLRSNRFRGGVSYTQACNSYFQGMGSDIGKAAGWRIMRGCYYDTDSPLFGSRIVNFVHDEFVLEVPESVAHEAVTELSRVMVSAAREWLPDVKIKADPVLMRCYSKEAKPIRDTNGRLVPWQLQG